MLHIALLPLLVAASSAPTQARPAPLTFAAVDVNAPLAALVAGAVAGDAVAIADLRATGPAGLDALLARGDAPAHVVDAVARQHDAKSSRLYWYTDLAAAKAEAARTHKPILSLRMLGNLDEELSCANSRFFRGLLYSDPRVARVLRERFVMHWQSVRPVPVVTVDMGDGRSFKTTITGNSVHLVLDERGLPVDAIPGMYSPDAFLVAIGRSIDDVKCGGRNDAARCLAVLHSQANSALDNDWVRDMKALGRDAQPQQATVKAPDESAEEIASRAMAKAVTERPLLRKLVPINDVGDQTLQRDVGRIHERDVHWDSQAIARFLAGRSAAFGRKLLTEISADTVQNEQQHHRAIHEWFVRSDAVTRTESALTKAIYDTIFATPSSDPWLGLGDVVDGAVIR